MVIRWSRVERAGTDDDDPEIGAALNLISLLCSLLLFHMHRYATPNSDAAVMASVPYHSFGPSDLFLVSDQSKQIHSFREQGDPTKGWMLTL
jgi:hypothetical protein